MTNEERLRLLLEVVPVGWCLFGVVLGIMLSACTVVVSITVLRWEELVVSAKKRLTNAGWELQREAEVLWRKSRRLLREARNTLAALKALLSRYNGQ